MGIPLRMSPVEIVGAVTVVAISVVTAARSTSQRIGIHLAHAAALEAEHIAEAERERALLAESAVTMERLAASLSHELNTPIGVLKSATETLFRSIRKREAACPSNGARTTEQTVSALSHAIATSTARLTETVARVQRFANLDRSAVRLADVNQLIRDAVALMNPPSATQTRVRLRLEPLRAIWCRPHAVSISVASILNKLLESADPVTIETSQDAREIIVRITQSCTETEPAAEPELRFSVVDGRVRASGWDLFAARQLMHETGGKLCVEHHETGERVFVIAIPADPRPEAARRRPA